MNHRRAQFLLATLLVLAIPTSRAAADPIKCRAAIVKEAATLAQTRFKILQKCEILVAAGKLPAGTICTTEPKTTGLIEKAEAKLRGGVGKACGGKNKLCNATDTGADRDDDLAAIGWGSLPTCPDLEGSGCTAAITDCNGIANCLICASGAPVERAIALSYSGVAFGPDKSLRSCQQSIGKETAKFFVTTSKILSKCWAAVNQGKKGFSAPCPGGDTSGKTAAAIAKAEDQKIKAICKACGGKDKRCDGIDDLSPLTIGFQNTCPALTVPAGEDCGGPVTTLDGLVECVDCVTTFKATCIDALAVPWGKSYPPECNPGCGNGVREAAEACDGADDAGCPGGCRSDCTCDPTVVTPTPTPTPTTTPSSTVSASRTPTPSGSGGETATPTATRSGASASPTATSTPTGIAPATLESSPFNGEDGVAVTRETILSFSRPLDPATVTASSVAGNFGGAALPARIHVSPDRKAVTLFYGHLPASARIRVSVNGNLLHDETGQPVDADNDGIAGGVGTIAFDTLTLTTLSGTEVHGRVFASELATTARGVAINTPLEGVTITVDGMEDSLSTVTDKDGNFSLRPAPVGRFFVHINGGTATNNGPAGSYYPFVGKAWESIPSRETDIGNIYLPLIPPNTLKLVDASADTEIHLAPDVIQQHPEFADVMINVPADSLFSDDGTRGGMVGIAPVAPDRLPGPLPAGLNLPIVITVQTDGPSNFDAPVPACFPNIADPITQEKPSAGSESALWSFNHDTGLWEIAGPMTVTPDGQLVCTDPGIGIRAPGWHGTQAGSSGSGSGGGCTNQCCSGGSADPGTARAASSDQDQCRIQFERCFELMAATSIGCGITCAFGPLPCIACMAAGLPWIHFCVEDTAKACDTCTSGGGMNTAKNTTAINESDPLVESRLLLDQVQPIYEQLDEVYSTIRRQNDPPTESQLLQIESLLADLSAAGGGDLPSTIESILARFPVTPSLPTLPPGTLDFAVSVAPNSILRGHTRADGSFSVNLPTVSAGTRVAIFDRATKSLGYTATTTNQKAGRIFQFPSYVLRNLQDATDRDSDSLADSAEQVVGTDPLTADTDGDGVDDGSEIDAGTNPLDGLQSVTGIIASARTPGNALDICVGGNKVVVADSTAGIVLFNVFRGMSPVIISQLDTVSSATAVACGKSRAVARLSDGGLAIVDLEAATPSLLYRLPASTFIGPATAVAAAGDTGLVGTQSGDLFLVDLRLGLILDRLPLGLAVQDLAVDGAVLYAVTGNSLRAIDLSTSPPNLIGQVATSSTQADGFTDRKRIFVGGGQAFVTAYPGYDVFNVTNPTAMEKIGSATEHGPNSFKQIVANGTGLGIAAVGVNPRESSTHDVYLYDVSNLAVTTDFVTSFETPGHAYAVAVHNALAYVADGAGGLQVINYLDFDRFGVPPTVSFATNADGNGSRVEEGSTLLVNVAVQDDVQIRNVDLLVDGQVVETDGSFPFQFFPPVPALDGRPPDQTTFTVAVRATDTGGNSTTTDAVVYAIAQDATPPRVLATTPNAGSVGINIAAISLRFNESIDSTSLASSAFTLTNLGANGTVGGGDDTAVSIASIQASAEGTGDRVAVVLSDVLSSGTYRLRMRKTGVTDLAGNAPAADFEFLFGAEPPPPLGTSLWTGGPQGSWQEPTNWSTGVVPGTNARVSIGRPGVPITLTFGGPGFSSASVQQMTVYGDVILTSGTLTLSGPSVINGSLTISGGARLIVTGTNGALSVTGSVTLQHANLTAQSGGKLDLRQADLYSRTVNGDAGITAQTNGVIDLSGLKRIDWGGNTLYITAQSGGRVDLSGLPAFEVGSRVFVTSTGAGSQVDLRNATAIGSTGNSFNLEFSGGAIALNAVRTFEGVVATLAQGGLLPTAQIETMNRSTVTVQGVTLPFTALRGATRCQITVEGASGGIDWPNLQTIDQSGFTARAGATLTLPAAISTFSRLENYDIGWLAETNGVLDFSHLNAIGWGGNTLYITAQSGGRVDLTGLPAFEVGSRVFVTSTGAGSQVDLRNATAIGSTGNSFNLEFSGGAIALNAVRSFEGVVATLAQGGLLPTAQIETMNRSTVTVQGVTLPFTALRGATRCQITVEGASGGIDWPNLQTINQSGFTARAGATLTLPAAISTFSRLENYDIGWLAETNGVLDFSRLNAIGWGGNTLYITAQSGGRVDLSGLPAFEVGSRVFVTSTGAGSQVDLRNATAIGSTGNSFNLGFSGGAIALNAVRTFEGVVATLAQGGLLPTAQIETMNRSTVTVQGVTLPFTALRGATRCQITVEGASGGIDWPNLQTINQSGFTARAGATLTLPAAISTFSRLENYDIGWLAETNGVLDFSHLSAISWPANTLFITARTAGLVKLDNLINLGSGGRIIVAADGVVSNIPSTVDLSKLAATQGTVQFNATNGGIIKKP